VAPELRVILQPLAYDIAAEVVIPVMLLLPIN
jgi:hypothetical protein